MQGPPGTLLSPSDHVESLLPFRLKILSQPTSLKSSYEKATSVPRIDLHDTSGNFSPQGQFPLSLRDKARLHQLHFVIQEPALPLGAKSKALPIRK